MSVSVILSSENRKPISHFCDESVMGANNHFQCPIKISGGISHDVLHDIAAKSEGGDSFLFFHQPREVRGRGKAAGFGDLRDGGIGGKQELFCLKEAAGDDIGAAAHTCGLFDEAVEVNGMVIQTVRQFRIGKRLAAMAAEVGDHRL